MNIAEFEQLPILGILRGIEEESIESLIDSIITSGMKTIEITMNTKNARVLIKKAVGYAKDKLCIGAGTVLDAVSLKAALDAGAEFIVMPTIVEDSIKYCVDNNIAVFPGALTPNEVFKAHSLGATMVKVFPASCFGPKYFKELKGPLDQVKLMAVGGVRQDNVKEYFACGASAVAVGASVFDLKQMAQKKFNIIEKNLTALIGQVKESIQS